MPKKAYVFQAPNGGPLHWGNFYNRHFLPTVAQSGMPAGLHFHNLRHTCAGFLIAEGAHPRALMERLAHSTINVTLGTYGHLLPSLEQDLTNRLDATGGDSRRSGHRAPGSPNLLQKSKARRTSCTADKPRVTRRLGDWDSR